MKKSLIIVALVVAFMATLSSCASNKSLSGCNMNKGYIGYGKY